MEIYSLTNCFKLNFSSAFPAVHTKCKFQAGLSSANCGNYEPVGWRTWPHRRRGAGKGEPLLWCAPWGIRRGAGTWKPEPWKMRLKCEQINKQRQWGRVMLKRKNIFNCWRQQEKHCLIYADCSFKALSISKSHLITAAIRNGRIYWSWIFGQLIWGWTHTWPAKWDIIIR